MTLVYSMLKRSENTLSPLLPVLAGLLMVLLPGAAYAQQEPKLMVPIGHTAKVLHSKFSPDGRRLVTVGGKLTIIWDLATGRRLAELQRTSRTISRGEGVVFSPDGTRLTEKRRTHLVQPKEVPLWDADGNLIATLIHQNWVWQAEFSPDSRHLLTADSRGEVKIWNAATGREEQTLTANNGLSHARYSPDGLRIITSGSSSVEVWDATTGQLIRELPLPGGQSTESGIDDALFSPDGTRIVTMSSQKAQVRDASSGALLTEMDLGGKYASLAFNRRGDALLSVASHSYDSEPVKLWQFPSGRLLATVWSGTEAANFAEFSPDGRYVVAGGGKPEILIWDATTGQKLHVLKGHDYGSKSVACTSDGSRLVVTESYKKPKLWDLQTGKLLGEFTNDADIDNVVLSPNGKKAVFTTGFNLQVWDLDRRQPEVEMRGYSHAVEKIAFSPDRKQLITSNQTPGSERLWNPGTGELQAQAMLAAPDADIIIYSPSYHKALKIAKEGGTTEIWDTQKGTVQAVLDKSSASGIGSGVFTPDEKKLVTIDKRLGRVFIRVWDVETGTQLFAMIDSQGGSGISEVFISANSTYAVTSDAMDGTISWNLATGKIAGRLPKVFGIKAPGFIGTSLCFITIQPKGTPRIWDAKTGGLVMTLKGHTGPLSYAVSPDRKRLLTWPNGHAADQFMYPKAKGDSVARLWDLEKRVLLTTLSGHKGGVEAAQFSANGRFIVTLPVEGDRVRVSDGHTGQKLHLLPTKGTDAETTIISKDGKLLFTTGGSNAGIEKWDLASGKRLLIIQNTQSHLSSLTYNDTTHELLGGNWGGGIILWDTNTGAIRQSFTGHKGRILAAQFGLTAGTLITASEDHTVKVWNGKTGALVNTLLPLGAADYINIVAGGYYKSSTGAARLLHYVTPDLKPISFEQLDVKYNRPDKVLAAMGSTDSVLLGAYRRAYQKRIRKLGLDTTQFQAGYNVPLANIRNQAALPYEQTQPTLRLELSARDSVVLLDRFNVWVNEVPMFGTQGISLRRARTHKLDTTITVNLSVGVNQLVYTVVNDAGAESYRQPLQVRFTPSGTPPEEKVYFAGIGLNEFAEPGHSLTWCVKDIRDLARALQEKYGSRLVVDTLFDSQVTLANVQALKKKLSASSIHDKVILAYSGHGLFSKSYDYYLSTYAVSFANPETGGLAYDELEQVLEQAPARKKLMLLDACHSGEIDREELTKLQRAAPQLAAVGVSGARGAIEANVEAGNKRVGMENSFELMRQLFVNVGRSTGITTISAAGGMQFALEQGHLRNGVFSYSVLEYMRANPTASVSGLKRYVIQRVSNLTAGMQVPTTRNEPLAVDWEVW
ncbi:caspase family protein [Hymenobacter sp. BT175]|uniref:caspase family protein n=1 Tax=Hymenobacter translucens TaxID=2886507 RepID=UPI001D0E29E1|nr:caspase family protein [Hymenobacter translucens]MCC2548230.1 caspase family protein [Hymenobacter translucens]